MVLQKRALAEELRFARDAELQFHARVLCSKMIGRWAAYKIGVDDVESYAQNIAMRQVVEPHRLLDLLRQDFSVSHVEVSDAEINARYTDFLDRAASEV